MFQHWSLLDVLVKGLATWRLSSMLVNEDGPNFILQNLRIRSGLRYDVLTEQQVVSWPAWNPLHCVACTSVYVSLVLALLPTWCSVPLALSGIAMVVERWQARQ